MANATEATQAPETASPDAKEVGLIRWLMWTRPIFGGILVAFGGLVTVFLVLPLGPRMDILSAGIGGWAGVVCGLIELLCGALILIAPSQRKLASLVAIIVGLLSFPMTNLGGLIVGMVCAVFGGCWAFGWVPNKPKLSKAERKQRNEAEKEQAKAEVQAEAEERDRNRDYVAETKKRITSWE